MHASDFKHTRKKISRAVIKAKTIVKFEFRAAQDLANLNRTCRRNACEMKIGVRTRLLALLTKARAKQQKKPLQLIIQFFIRMHKLPAIAM